MFFEGDSHHYNHWMTAGKNIYSDTDVKMYTKIPNDLREPISAKLEMPQRKPLKSYYCHTGDVWSTSTYLDSEKW